MADRFCRGDNSWKERAKMNEKNMADNVVNKNVQQWQGVPLDADLTKNMDRFDEILQVRKTLED